MKKHPMSRDVTGKKNPRYRPVWDRFWEKVDKSGDCWLWTAAKNSYGYGCFGVDGKLVQPHRFIMSAPDGVCVLHHCDTPACVNPEHLYFGDRKQNALDRDTRGRNGMQNLCDLDIKLIYDLDVPISKIADWFGVCHAVVSRIKNGTSYKHITTNRGLDRRS